MSMTDMPPTVLIVIPALNEASHIAAVMDFAAAFANRQNGLVVVVDGGSTDGTQQIVAQRAAAEPRVKLLHNPGRLQSAGVNLAVDTFGAGVTWLLRLDAHSAYPSDYGDVLINEARAQNADSVVVSMHAQGAGPLQRLIAAAQNSRIGNGGSAHRLSGDGKWVDHGHHALMRMAAFTEVCGYDPAFSHNEDAELDHRLKDAGHRIWLTGRTRLIYFPRDRIGALLKQYFNFGRGRARNLLKNNTRPAPRQAIVAMLAPAIALAVFSPWHWAFAVPLMLWVLGCALGGVMIAAQTGRFGGVVAGPLAGLMHLAWSAGFWRECLARVVVTKRRSPG